MKLITSILAILTATSLAQGPLAPPGAPAPMMKTLDEIHAVGEKRTPISTIPFAITQSGSYYLTGNLSTALAVDGISIDAKDVTIDLNGFLMTGSGVGVAAIKMTNATFNTQTLVVKNGVIDGFATAIGGVSGSVNAASIENVHIKGGNGIQLGEANNARIHGCVLQGCVVSPAGVELGAISAGRSAVVSECRIAAATGNNLGYSIYVTDNGIVRNCTVTDTGIAGIKSGSASSVLNCSVAGAAPFYTAITVAEGNVEGCSVKGTFGIGISSFAIVTRCSIALNGSPQYGILGAAKVSNCSVFVSPAIASGTGIQASSSIVEGSSVFGFGTGIYASGDALVRHCSVGTFSDTGIRLGIRDTAIGNKVRNRAIPVPLGIGITTAIDENTIDGNLISGCATGINVTAAGNIIHRNTLRNNTTPLSIVGGNDVGPTGTSATATSPFANIVY